MFTNPTKISCTGFVKNQNFNFEIFPTEETYVLSFLDDFNIFKKGSVLKLNEPDIKPILRLWFKELFKSKMPKVDMKSELYAFSCSYKTTDTKFENIIPKSNTYYKLDMLNCNTKEVESQLSSIIPNKTKQFNSVDKIEMRIQGWIKSKGFNITADDFMDLYYPDSHPLDILDMSVKEECFDQAIEEVIKNAEIGSCNLSVL